VARHKCRIANAHSGIIRMSGPKSGEPIVNIEMPAISSTASTACRSPMVARPSWNTAQ
jgi:hypothetical protein